MAAEQAGLHVINLASAAWKLIDNLYQLFLIPLYNQASIHIPTLIHLNQSNNSNPLKLSLKSVLTLRQE